LLSLPSGHDYRVVFMQRPLPEVLASQDEMLRHRGTAVPGANPAIMSAAFEKHLREVFAWLDSKPYVETLRLPYHDVLRDPKGTAQKLVQFLDADLNTEVMSQQVDASLYRNRSK
jgi:hypothetical protein